MDTKKLFRNFYKKDQAEIAKLVHSFIVGDFFVIHPELKSKVSILITGSVASKHYDNKSDIDLTIIFPTEKAWKEYKYGGLSVKTVF
jgi:predicted nucleotidyltransferase